jgi:hypothetical protein
MIEGHLTMRNEHKQARSEHRLLVQSLVRGLPLDGYGYHQAFIRGGTKTIYVVPHQGLEGFAFNLHDLTRAQVSQVDYLALCNIVQDRSGTNCLEEVAHVEFGTHILPLVEKHARLWRGNCKIVLKRELPAFLEELRQ